MTCNCWTYTETWILSVTLWWKLVADSEQSFWKYALLLEMEASGTVYYTYSYQVYMNSPHFPSTNTSSATLQIPVSVSSVHRFIHRYPELETACSQIIEATLVTEATKEGLDRWFDEFEKIIEEKYIRIEDMYDMVEMGFAAGYCFYSLAVGGCNSLWKALLCDADCTYPFYGRNCHISRSKWASGRNGLTICTATRWPSMATETLTLARCSSCARDLSPRYQPFGGNWPPKMGATTP